MKPYFYLYAIVCLLTACHAGPEKKTMHPNEPAALLTEPAASGIIIHVYQNSSNGYGYRIAQSGKDLIEQPHIPAIPENKAFASREDALQTAELVKQKMEKGIFPPAITIKELDSMHIRY